MRNTAQKSNKRFEYARVARPTRKSASLLYAQGETSPVFFARLNELCTHPWQPFAFAGRHQCELCQFDPPSFGENLFVPHAGQIFVAPVGIVHYIAGGLA
jgi:hypothetical protein